MQRTETPWAGWYFWNGYLVDPDGNKYSQDMIRSSIFTQQLKYAMTGSELKIYSLKQELEKRLAVPLPEIVIRWNGEETVITPPKAAFK